MAQGMGQAGVLGNLKYAAQENGWALTFGYNLGTYEILSLSPPAADESPNIEKRRATARRDMNHELKTRGVNFIIPDVNHDEDGIIWLVQELFDQFGRQSLSSELGFVLIGNAAYCLILRGIVGTSLDDYLVKYAYDRLENLSDRCEDANVQIDALFMLLSRCNTLRDVRRLLRNLHTQMTILMVSADPRDQGRLRLLREERALQDALQSADRKLSFKFAVLPSCKPQDLASGLRRHKPTFIHFSGHASREGLCFEDHEGRTVLIEPEKLAGLLSLACEGGLKGIVMNACYTKEQADPIADVVGHVVAMDGLLGDDAAIDFASQFYGAIGDGEEFHRAFEWALAGTGLGVSIGPLKPVLIRSRIFNEAHYKIPKLPAPETDTTPGPEILLQEAKSEADLFPSLNESKMPASDSLLGGPSYNRVTTGRTLKMQDPSAAGPSSTQDFLDISADPSSSKQMSEMLLRKGGAQPKPPTPNMTKQSMLRQNSMDVMDAFYSALDEIVNESAAAGMGGVEDDEEYDEDLLLDHSVSEGAEADPAAAAPAAARKKNPPPRPPPKKDGLRMGWSAQDENFANQTYPTKVARGPIR